jgi:hypothetical protein
MVNETIKPILELKSPYSDPQKSIVMYAIGQLAGEEKSSLQGFLDLLLPLIAVYIEIPRYRKPILLRAALTCFPAILHSDRARNVNMMDSIWPMMVDKDREVSKLGTPTHTHTHAYTFLHMRVCKCICFFMNIFLLHLLTTQPPW